MALHQLANMIRGTALREHDRTPVGQTMQQRVQASPMIEQEEIEGAHGRPRLVKFHQQALQIMQHPLGLSRGPGSEQDEPRGAPPLQLVNEAMRLGWRPPRNGYLSLKPCIDLKLRADHIQK